MAEVVLRMAEADQLQRAAAFPVEVEGGKPVVAEQVARRTAAVAGVARTPVAVGAYTPEAVLGVLKARNPVVVRRSEAVLGVLACRAAVAVAASPEAQVCRTAGEPVVAQAVRSPVVGEVVEPSEAHRSEPVVAAGLVGPHMTCRNSLPRTWHDH